MILRPGAIALGEAPPDDINLLVTTSVGAEPMAMSVDDHSGALTVARLFHTTMRAPGNMAVIPQTVGDDGVPVAALLITSHVIGPGTIVAARPIGVLHISGAAGDEVTVLTLPVSRLTTRYDAITSYSDLPAGHLRQIAHFFRHYRDLEDPSRESSAGWGDLNEARRTILEGAERATSRRR